MLASRASRLNPCGPTIIPDTIKPIMLGNRSLPNRIGASRIIKSTSENKITGSLIGRESSKRKSINKKLIPLYNNSLNLNKIYLLCSSQE
jgi:hypothetical protein